MGKIKKLKKELNRMIKSYKDVPQLSEYAQGRYANTKMILDIIKDLK